MRYLFTLRFSLLLLSALFLFGCGEEHSTTAIVGRNIQLYVGSRTPDEVTWFSEDSQPTYFIKNNTSEAWEVTSYPIVGLDYEQGYEYYIEVTLFHEHTPDGLQDHKEYYYRVERLISKEKKDSQIPLVNRPEDLATPNKHP